MLMLLSHAIPTSALLPGWRSPRVVVSAPMMTVVAPSGLSVLSVAELKRLLSARGVDFRDCLEKRDLVERLESADGQSSSSRDGDGAPLSLTDGERRRIETFHRVSPSVAYIQTVQQQRPFSMRAMEVPVGTGSGFVWDGLGHVVTNYHVIAMRGTVPERVRVTLQGSTKSFEAKVFTELDLALSNPNTGPNPNANVNPNPNPNPNPDPDPDPNPNPNPNPKPNPDQVSRSGSRPSYAT